MSKQIVIVRVYDYQALYVDGVRVWEDHEISPYELADHLPNLSLLDADEDWFGNRSGFPESLSDVVLDPPRSKA